MKKINFGVLALSVLAGSTVAGFAVVGPISGDAGLRDNAYYDTLGKDYDLTVQFNTNNPAIVIAVTGLPVLSRTTLIQEIRGAVDTDASGKIDGAHYATIYWDGQSSPKANFTTFNIDVTGSIGSRGSVPFVRLSLKGLGYDVGTSSNYTADAMLNLTFVSNGSLHSVSNVVDVGTGTNEASAVNAWTELSGTVNGTIRRGLRAQPIKLIGESATLRTGNFGHDNEGIIVGVDPNNPNLATFTPYNIGLVSESITTFNVRVVQPSAKFKLVGGFEGSDDIAGSGAVDKIGGFKASLRGSAHHRGPKLRMTGRTGDLTIDFVNGDPVVVSGALKNNIVIFGKYFGQLINLTGGTGLDVQQ